MKDCAPPPSLLLRLLALALAMLNPIAHSWVQADDRPPEIASPAEMRTRLQAAAAGRAAGILAAPLYEFAGRMLEEDGQDLVPESLAGITDLAEEFRLVSSIQQMLLPGPKTKGKPVARYGAICELLRDREGAIAHYERALESEPEDQAVRLRLFKVMLVQELPAALPILEGLSGRHLDVAGDRLVDIVSSEEKFNAAAKIVDDTAKILASRDGNFGESQRWVPEMFDQLVEGKRTDLYAPPFYREAPFGRSHTGWRAKHRPEVKPDRLNALHERYFRMALASPKLAQEAFRRLAARPAEELRGELPALAKLVLLKASSSAGAEPTRPDHYELPKPSAAEFLANQALQIGDEEIGLRLEEIDNPEVAAELMQWRALYLGDEDEFADAAGKRIAIGDGAAVVRCWIARESQTELTPLLIGQIKNDSQFQSALSDYLKATLLRDGPGALDTRLQQVTAALLGADQEAWAAGLGSTSAQGGQDDPPLRRYLAVLASLLNTPALTFPTLKHFEKQFSANPELSYLPAKLLSRDHPATDETFYRVDFEGVKRFFADSAFINDFATFPLFVTDDPDSHHSFTLWVLSTISGLPERARDRLRGYFQTLPPSFGKNVLVAAARDPIGTGLNYALLEFGNHREELEAMPAGRRQRYMTFSVATVATMGLPPRFEKERVATIKWLLGLDKIRLEEESAARLAAAVNDPDLVERRRTIIKESLPLLEGLARKDPAAAKSILGQVSQSAGGTPGKRFAPDDAEPSPANELLCDYLRNRSESIRRAGGPWRLLSPDGFDRLEFASQVMTGIAEGDVPIEWNADYRTAIDILGRKFARANRAPHGKAIIGFAEVLAGEIEPEQAPVIIDATFGIMGHWSELGREEFEELSATVITALEAGAAAGKNAAMVNEILMAVRLFTYQFGQQWAKGVTDREKLPPEQAHYLAILEGDSLSPLAKLGLAEAVVGAAGIGTEPPLTHAFCQLLIDNLVAGERICTPQITGALARLRGRDLAGNDAAPLQGEAQRLSEELVGLLEPQFLPEDWSRDPEQIVQRQEGAFLFAELCLLTGNPDTAREIFSAYPDDVHDFPVRWLHRLARHGLTDLAADLIRSDFEFLSIAIPDSNYSFDDRLATRIPAVSAAAGNDGLAYLAEVILSSFPQEAGGAGGHETDARSERLTALAKRFPKSLREPAARESAILLLASTLPSARVAKPLLAKVSTSRPLSQLIGVEGTEVERLRLIHQAHIYADVADGQTGALRAAIADLSPGATVTGNFSSMELHQIVKNSTRATMKHWYDWTPRQAEAMCRAWRQALATPNFALKTVDGVTHSVFIIFLHAMFDQMGQLETAIAGLPDDLNQHLSHAGEISNLTYPLGRIPKPDFRGPEGEEQTRLRVNIVKRALDNPLGFAPSPAFTELFDRGWITREQFIAAGDELASETPAGGLTPLWFACHAIEAGDPDKAALLLAATDDLPETALSYHTQVQRARVAYDLGKLETAYRAYAAALRIANLDQPIGATTLGRDELSRLVRDELIDRSATQQAADGDPMPMLRTLEKGEDSLPDVRTFWRLVRDSYAHASAQAEKDGDMLRALGFVEAATLADVTLVKLQKERPAPPLGDPRVRFLELLKEQVGDPMVLIPKEAPDWQYFDAGTAPPEGWQSPDFDASGWESGTAPFGYGEKDGHNTLIAIKAQASNEKVMAAYFRHSFEIGDLEELTTLVAELRRDDGAAVYLNGKEIARQNLPDSELDYSSKAISAISGGDETIYRWIQISPELVKPGLNTIAIEVHQVNEASSDVSFDLHLRSNDFRKEDMDQVPQPGSIEKKIGEAWTVLSEATKKMR